MSKEAIGAKVLYCGHNGWFIADIWRVGDVNVIHASAPISGDMLVRGRDGEATHHISNFPNAGFWRPKTAVLVVPEVQCKELK